MPDRTSAGAAKRARRLAKRAFRDRERRFLAEGPQALREALGHGSDAVAGDTVGGDTVTELFVTQTARARHGDLVDAAAAQGVPVHLISDALMSELAQTVTPQGLLAICRFVDLPLEQSITTDVALVAILANVRDPGNAGTVLRAADAAGADAVIFADASVDPYNGKCVRASAGSLFHVPVTTGVKLGDAVRKLHEAGLRIVAADGSAADGAAGRGAAGRGGAGRTLDNLAVRAGLARPTAWLFGNEAWGLPPELLDQADDTVAVPIYGKAESLNLATAATVCLYASAFAHRAQAEAADGDGT